MLLTVLTSLIALSLVADAQTYDSNLIVRCMNEGEALLTYDGGPSSNNTGHLLDLLKKENITAAFFITAANAQQYEGLTMRILKEGHAVGYRLEQDWNVTKMTDEALYNSIEYKLEQIKKVLDRRPRIIRANLEDNDKNNNGLANSMVQKLRYAGYSILGERVSAKDGNMTNIGKWPEPVQAVNQAVALLNPANDAPIIRLHDTNWLTINQTLGILGTIKQRGFKVVNITQCLGVDAVYAGEPGKIGKFYGEASGDLSTPPEDQGKIFTGQIPSSKKNAATTYSLNPMMIVFPLVAMILA
jgi:peptidoglycan/xylan/chitin deacetylase (PgdA/CDA1 family)